MSSLEKQLAGLNKKKANMVINCAVHYVVDHVREISDHAPALAFRSLARKMCAKYEKVFADTLSDGQRQGTGYANLQEKLIERNRYLNRPHMTNSLYRTLKLPLKEAKKYKNIKAGCIDWQPNFPEGHDENTTETLRKYFLNFLDINVQTVETLTKCVEDFSKCFPLQRLHLNQKEAPTAEAIRQLWPCLFTDLYANIHFQLLTGREPTTFQRQFESYVRRILIHGHVTLDVESQEFVNWAVLKIIFEYFKEDFTNLFTIMEEVCVKLISKLYRKYFSYSLQHYIFF